MVRQMYLKALGAILVLFSTTSIGYLLSRRLHVRIDSLQAVLSGFQLLGSEIGYLKTPMNEAFLKAAGGASGHSFFYEVVQEQKKEGAFIADSYEKALLQNYKRYDLTEKDLNILLEFKNNLGMCDLDSQLQMIEYIKKGIGTQIEEGRRIEQKYGKLYKSLGFLAGAFLVVLFL